MFAEGSLNRPINEAGYIGTGQAGGEVLVTSENLQLQGLAEILGERERFVGTAAETAAEARVARIGVHVDPGQTAKGDAEHLVERVVLVAGPVTESHVGAEPDLLVDLDAGARAESLHQVFVEQSGLNQTRIERRQITEVGVVQAEFDARVGLDANGGETAAKTEARAPLVGGSPVRIFVVISRLRINLCGLIDREDALVEDAIFEEEKGSVRAPLQHLQPAAAGGRVTEIIVATAFEIDEGASNFTVGRIAVRRGIGRRPQE